MTIEAVERFVTLGREFRSHQEAVSFRVDHLAEFLDPALGIWTPGEKLKLVQFLVDNRGSVRALLDF